VLVDLIYYSYNVNSFLYGCFKSWNFKTM